MNSRTPTWLAWSLSLTTLVLLCAGLGLWALNGFPVLLGANQATGGAPFRILAVLTFALIAVVGLLIARRQPASPIGWIMLIAVLVSTFDLFSQNLGGYAYDRWPVAVRWAAAAAFPLNVSAGLVALLLLLFPNGRLPSPRWRIVLWPTIAVGVLQGLTRALRPEPLRVAPTEQNPFGAQWALPILPALEAVAQIGLLLGLVLAALSLVLRWRHARGEERQQLRWIALAAPPWALAFAVTLAVPPALRPAARVVYFLTLDVFVLALGVAVLRYRLYDIDLVINKAIVYGALAVFVTAVYVAVVLGISSAVNASTELDVWLSLLATIIVAVAFQPMREQAQRLANRLVYGRRASPYEVLADFSRGLATALSSDAVLPRMAEAAAHGVGASRARVRVYVPGGSDRAVAWPPEAVGLPFERTVPVLHQGAMVGEIALSKPPGAPFTPADTRLLADLAAQSGAALHGVRLDIELQARLEQISAQASELRASRQRIVAAQDAERRRIERDLHDGAQQHLVALSINLGMLEDLVGDDPAAARELLTEARGQAVDALSTLRDLARGIYPAALTDNGIVAALQGHLAKSHGAVSLEVDDDDDITSARFPRDLEAAVYFCILEALQNCAKHAPNAHVQVRLRADPCWLSFDVSDDGPGFEHHGTGAGSGLQGMADRLAAVGGMVTVRAAPGQGATITGRVPLGAQVTAASLAPLGAAASRLGAPPAQPG